MRKAINIIVCRCYTVTHAISKNMRVNYFISLNKRIKNKNIRYSKFHLTLITHRTNIIAFILYYALRNNNKKKKLFYKLIYSLKDKRYEKLNKKSNATITINNIENLSRNYNYNHLSHDLSISVDNYEDKKSRNKLSKIRFNLNLKEFCNSFVSQIIKLENVNF